MKTTRMIGNVAARMLVLGLAGLASATGSATEGALWQLHWHNDALTSSDNMFTSGIALEKASALFADLAGTHGTPAFGKPLARLFLPDQQGLHYREDWQIGQNIYTPSELYIEELLLNDTPYAGMVGWSNGFSAFDERRFSGFGLLLGWTGDEAFGEELQSATHDFLDRTEPRGWDSQLEFEPLLNVYLTRKHKIWSTPRFDGAVSLDAAVGNFLTQGQASLEMRFGRAPEGFSSLPSPVGAGLNYHAALRQPGFRYFYVTVALRGTGLIHSLPLHGNLLRDDTWSDQNVVDPRPFRGELLVAVHREWSTWGIHVAIFFGTNAVEENDKLFPSVNATNSYGTVTLEWQV
ncbi:MAG TPA: lipid A deacylase LpxR family protein [Rhodothermales bacterium]